MQFLHTRNAFGLHVVKTHALAFQAFGAGTSRLASSLQALLLKLCLCLRLACAFASRCQSVGNLQSFTRLQHLDLAVYLVLLCLQCLGALFRSPALPLCGMQVSAQPCDTVLHTIFCKLRTKILTSCQLRPAQSEVLLRTVQAFSRAVGLLNTFFFGLDRINTLDCAYDMRGGLT